MTQPTKTCETCAHNRPDGIRDLYPCGICRVMHVYATDSMWRAKPTCATCLHVDESREGYPCCECEKPRGVFTLWEARTDQAESGESMIARAVAAVVADVRPFWVEVIERLRRLPKKVVVEMDDGPEPEPKPERFCYQCRHNPSNRSDEPCAGCWPWPGKPNWSAAEAAWEPPLYHVTEDGMAHFTCIGTREDPQEREKYHAGLRQAMADIESEQPDLSPPIRTLDAKQCREVAAKIGYELALLRSSILGVDGLYRRCNRDEFKKVVSLAPWAEEGPQCDVPWRDALRAAAYDEGRLCTVDDESVVYLGALPRDERPGCSTAPESETQQEPEPAPQKHPRERIRVVQGRPMCQGCTVRACNIREGEMCPRMAPDYWYTKTMADRYAGRRS